METKDIFAVSVSVIFMTVVLHKTVRIFMRNRSRLRDYLSAREEKYLCENDNIVDYEFCEKTSCNIVIVKDENQKIRNSLWGTPLMIYKEETNKSPYRENAKSTKIFIRKTTPEKTQVWLFKFACFLDSIGREKIKLSI